MDVAGDAEVDVVTVWDTVVGVEATHVVGVVIDNCCAVDTVSEKVISSSECSDINKEE